MMIKDILSKISHVNINEKRTISEEYSELVFLNKDIEELYKVFAGIFGQPLKKQGAKPSKDILRLTKEYGGVWEDQTLFKKDNEQNTIIAMFWPWQDNMHTTLKMAAIKNI
ncbi:MAG: hypothetical protein PHT53_05555 [Candidatus Omnitrophica bacterium]|nr:hypothetical protein [Candidatus Omnitrophota bacterium]